MPAPIVYFEIAGPDGPKLKRFYSTIFGWTIDGASELPAGQPAP